MHRRVRRDRAAGPLGQALIVAAALVMLGALAGACGGSPAAPVADVSSKTTTTTSASCLATGPPRRRGTAQRPAPGKSYSRTTASNSALTAVTLGPISTSSSLGSQGHHGSVEPGATRRCQTRPSNHVAGACTTSVVAEGHYHALFVPEAPPRAMDNESRVVANRRLA